MAGLPYDALTAALDAWLAQHIPNLRAARRPFPAPRVKTTYSSMASGAPDAIAATLRHTRDVISNYAPQQWRFAFAHM